MTKVVETELTSERERKKVARSSKSSFERTWNKIKVRIRIWRKM